jgi:hypothetical protein
MAFGVQVVPSVKRELAEKVAFFYFKSNFVPIKFQSFFFLESALQYLTPCRLFPELYSQPYNKKYETIATPRG